MKTGAEIPQQMLGTCLTIQQLHTGNVNEQPVQIEYPSKSLDSALIAGINFCIMLPNLKKWLAEILVNLLRKEKMLDWSKLKADDNS